MTIAARMNVLYDQLRVTQLKARLRRQGIPFPGLRTKQQLINRLVAAESERIRTATPKSRSHLPSTKRTSIVDTLVVDFSLRVMMVATAFSVVLVLMQIHYNSWTNKYDAEPKRRLTPEQNTTYAIDNGKKISVLSLIAKPVPFFKICRETHQKLSVNLQIVQNS